MRKLHIAILYLLIVGVSFYALQQNAKNDALKWEVKFLKYAKVDQR